MKDARKSTLGYFLTTSKPETVNSPAPTFPVSAMKYQNYQYIAPGKQTPEEGLKEGEHNMLLYLGMTQDQQFPREDILEYSGNSVIPQTEGTVCISRDVFWDWYLLRNPSLEGPNDAASSSAAARVQPPPLCLAEFSCYQSREFGDCILSSWAWSAPRRANSRSRLFRMGEKFQH